MPDFAYAFLGTLTFDSNMDLSKKYERIQGFPKFMGEYLPFFQKTQYYLKYSIEYHKVCNEDDPEAPHVHFVLYSHLGLANRHIRAINAGMREFYGRCQFFRGTTMKTAQWEVYMNKDVERLDLKFNKPHNYELYIEQTMEPLKWGDIDYWEEWFDDFE